MLSRMTRLLSLYKGLQYKLSGGFHCYLFFGKVHTLTWEWERRWTECWAPLGSIISHCFKCHISKTNKIFWGLSLEVADVHQRRIRKFTDNCHTSFSVFLDGYVLVTIQFTNDSGCLSGACWWYLGIGQCRCRNKLLYKFSWAVLLDVITMIISTYI